MVTTIIYCDGKKTVTEERQREKNINIKAMTCKIVKFVGLKGEDSDENKSIYFSNRGRENKEENKTERNSRTEAISGWKKRDT